MKKTIISLVLTTFALGATAHEAITIGPHGGRIIYLDSTEVPNVEILVNAEGRAVVYLLDKDRKPITLDQQTITVTAGPRSSARKLTGEKHGIHYQTGPVPDGTPYFIIVQIKATADAKPMIARVDYDPTPAGSGKPKYLDDSVNAQSGENIPLPDTVAGIWAELNQHQVELAEGIAGKKHEAIDEITRAYPALAKGLAAKSGDQADAATALVGTLVKHLAAVREASAARTLDAAQAGLEGIATTLEQLKKLYPDDIANAKLEP